MTPTFTWPTARRAISSRFTDPRPYGQHNAVDIPGRLGSPVQAIAAGRVIFANWAGSAGLSVWIDHAEGWRSHYCHLRTVGVRVGQMVDQGQHIADVGMTGDATGPHLHLNLFAPTRPSTGLSAWVAWVGKWAVNPLDYLVEEDDMADLQELEKRVDALARRKVYQAHVARVVAAAVLLSDKGTVNTAQGQIRNVEAECEAMAVRLRAGEISP